MSEIRPIRKKWKGTMTDRERFNAQMHYRPFDRSFNMEFGYWPENYDRWPVFLEQGIRDEWQAETLFQFDIRRGIAGRMGMEPAFEERVVSETATTKIISDRNGLLAEVPKDGHATIPHFLKSSIETPEDWKKVKAERFRLDDRVIDIAWLKQFDPEGRDYPLGIDVGSMIGNIRDWLTFEGLCYAIYDYPEMVEDMVETCCLLTENSIDQMLPHFQFDFACGWEDICFKNGPIVPPDFFRDVIMPRYKRISKKLKQYGVDIWYMDCDGDVRPILPYFLEGGVNCLFPYEVNACGHPGELFREYGRDLHIMGGIDKMQLIAGKDQIKAYLESIGPLVEQGGFIPFCDHLCPPDVSQENYLYYLDLKEQMFGMK